MGLFGNIFNKPDKESGAKILMNLIVDNSSIVLDKSLNIDKGFIFELLICTSIQVINAYDELYTNTTSQFQTKYLNELLKYCEANKIQPRIEGDVIDFLNLRIIFYDKELRRMFSEHAIVPVKIVHNFYESPLKINSGESENWEKCFKLTEKLNNIFDLINKNIHIARQ